MAINASVLHNNAAKAQTYLVVKLERGRGSAEAAAAVTKLPVRLANCQLGLSRPVGGAQRKNRDVAERRKRESQTHFNVILRIELAEEPQKPKMQILRFQIPVLGSAASHMQRSAEISRTSELRNEFLEKTGCCECTQGGPIKAEMG